MEKLYIKIAGLKDGEYDYEFNEPIEKLDLKAPFVGKFEVNAALQKSVHQVIVDYALKVNATLECDRCSEEYSKELVSKFKIVYLFGKSREEGEEEEIDLKYLPAEVDKINISEELREYALLSLPMKNLCSEDCRGLCPKCGANLNKTNCNCSNDEVDPRWSPLSNLKN